MSVRLLGMDPSPLVLEVIREAVEDVPVGYDMPDGDRKVWLTLSAGAYPTPVTQRWTLTVSVYDASPSGVLDHMSAQSTWMAAARAVLHDRHVHPLCDAEVQSGPLVNHDADLDVDYVYGALMLTVTAN